ncbi:MAG TPA: zf-HC2 domain-containing protein [Bryobacteraceae bacterium]|jgi:anti-sigma factor RsiW|nr:zf-HC2 domain-containing protein [Bryobacteraceae bacterium]
MFTRHISRQLAAHLDGQLSQPEARQAELHLEQCPRCRAEYDRVNRGMALMEHLPPVEAPEAIWSSIEQAFQQTGHEAYPTLPAVFSWSWALVAIVVLALIGAAWWRIAGSSRTRWEVVRLDGSPLVGAKPIQGAGPVGAGEWIETDARSRATVQVGKIGSVEVSPNTRVQVVTAREGEHRIALARGEIRAKITAPPRLFFVDTASGTAVDLGCEYELSTNEEGSGMLHVSKGWVSFQWKGLESLVPAGASCRTRPHDGPGIPYFDDAPESVKQASDVLGFEKAGNDALGAILSGSRVRDTLTLWHLLARVEGSDRARVFDRIAALTPVPAGVSRGQALKLDPPTLKHWMEELAWTW